MNNRNVKVRNLDRRTLLKGMTGMGLLAATGKIVAGPDAISEPLAQELKELPRMKISAVDTIMTGRDVFVKISTDAGITGYGDATNHFLPYSVKGMLEDISPFLLGEDPQRIEYLWQVCYRRRFMRGGPATGSALAGIDQALWDIKGKALGVPVYQLLGGMARTRVRVYGHVGGQTAEEAAAQAKLRVERGITAIRFRAFHSYDRQDFHDHKLGVRQQIEYLAAIRDAVGDDTDLILECHGRYDPEWARKLADLAKPYNPFFIEDPVRHENPEALQWLRKHTDIPLAIGERYHDKWDCRETIVNQYVDYLRPDVCHCGGISEMKKIAAMAEVYYINLVPHNNAGPLGSAATLHAALSIPNITLIEAPFANSDRDPVVTGPFPQMEDGFALPLEGPGLGITVDEDAAAERPFTGGGLQPKLNSGDGSVRDF
jgi:galactonate dehydratase